MADNEVYGCFSCGRQGEDYLTDGNLKSCPNCGRPTVVPFSQALAVMQFLEGAGLLIAADTQFDPLVMENSSFTLVLPEGDLYSMEDFLDDWESEDEYGH